jgi:hypothetical protein
MNKNLPTSSSLPRCFCGSGKALTDCCGKKFIDQLTTRPAYADVFTKLSIEEQQNTARKARQPQLSRQFLVNLKTLGLSQQALDCLHNGLSHRAVRKDPVYWATLVCFLSKPDYTTEISTCFQYMFENLHRKPDVLISTQMLQLVHHGFETELLKSITEYLPITSQFGVQVRLFLSSLTYDTKSAIADAIQHEFEEQIPDSVATAVCRLDRHQSFSDESYRLGVQAHEKFPESLEVAVAFFEQSYAQGKYAELAESKWIQKVSLTSNLDAAFNSSQARSRILQHLQIGQKFLSCLQSKSETKLKECIEQLQDLHRSKFRLSQLLVLVAIKTTHALNAERQFIPILKEFIQDEAWMSTTLAAHFREVLVRFYVATEQYEEAVQFAEQLCTRFPTDEAFRELYLLTLALVDREDEAVRLVEQDAAETQYLSKSKVLTAGRICAICGLIGKAQFYYETLCELGDDSAEVLEPIAMAKLFAGKIDEAQEIMEKSLKKREACGTLNFTEYHRQQVERLFEFAKSRHHNIAFAYDLFAFSEELENRFGVWNQLQKTTSLSTQSIFDVFENENPAERAQLRFELTLRDRGDCSALITEIVEIFGCYDGLPKAAQYALVEGEKLFRDPATKDYSSAILAYCKSLEILLRESAFLTYQQTVSQSTLSDTRAILAGEDGRKSRRFLEFLENRKPITFGEMLYVLQQLTAYAGIKVPVFVDFKLFLESQNETADLLSSAVVSDLTKISRHYRNPAAHQYAFTQTQAQLCRELLITVFKTLKFEKASAIDKYRRAVLEQFQQRAQHSELTHSVVHELAIDAPPATSLPETDISAPVIDEPKVTARFKPNLVAETETGQLLEASMEEEEENDQVFGSGSSRSKNQTEAKMIKRRRVRRH